MMLVGIPLLSIILFFARFVFKTKVGLPWKVGMWSVWFANLTSLAMIASLTRGEFNQRVKQDITNAVIETSADTIVIKQSENLYDDILIQLGDLKVAGDELISQNVRIAIEKAEGSQLKSIFRLMWLIM